MAEQYGAIHGKALDKDGNGIAGVSLKLQNGDYKTIATSVTGADGSYSFDQVPSPSGADLYRIIAALDTDGSHRDSGTAFFEVLALRLTAKDIHFDDYPPSGIGCLYGIVASDQNLLYYEPATVYLDNGMFFPYAGGRFDTWTFEKLPHGQYVVWAETNIGNITYTSERKTVTVVTDERNYMPIYLPVYISGTNTVAYHAQPVQMKNIVHGTILQKNGVPYAGARVDLYRVSGSAMEYVSSTTANEAGQYVFDSISVEAMSEKYLVRASFMANGASQTQDSGVFTVYYANTLGVPHDINVPVSLGFVNSGSMVLQSVPSGAVIIIDGFDTHYVTPYNLTGLQAGSHAVCLSLDEYFNDNFTVQLQADATVTLNRTLKPGTGSTFLDVKPAGAAVYLDGKYAGTSPLSLTKYTVGTHTYTVACDGYRDESGTIEIVPGEATTKEIDMVATPGLNLTYIGYLISSFINQIFSMF